MADDPKKPAPPPAAPKPAPPPPAAKEEAKPFAAKPAAGEAEADDADAGIPPSRGAQVILDGEALTAARGGAAADMQGNVDIKKGLEAEGEVADGSTPDGSTLTGKPAKEVVLEEHQSGVAPAKKD